MRGQRSTHRRSAIERRRTTGTATTREAALDEAAFGRLYRELWPAVVDYLRFRIGASEATDVAAEAFTRAWRARAQYDAARGALKPWLWSIARNAATDHLRQRSAVQVELDAESMGDGHVDDDIATALEMDRVVAAAKTLHPTDQEIIALRFGAGFTNRAIGDLIGRSEGDVAVRLHRALRRIRHDLAGRAGR